MKKGKRNNILKQVLQWQMLAVIIAILLTIMRWTDFWKSLLDSMIMTNSIVLWAHLVELALKKRFDVSRLRRSGNIFYWTVIIIVGGGIGTFMGISIIAFIFNHPFFPLIHSEFLPIFYFCLFITTVYVVWEIVYTTLKESIARKVRENEELKHLQLRTQLMALQAKVNPHFLFNTLNTMLNLVHKYPDKVEIMLLNLSDIYRRVLQLPENRFIGLKEELLLVKEYLEIEKIRLEDRLNYTIDVAPGLDNILIPPLLIEPIVENAVIHGISTKTTGGTVQITIRENNKMLEIKIADDGKGIEIEKLQTASFGLHSVKERIRLIYKENAQFRINLVPDGGTCVTLELPPPEFNAGEYIDVGFNKETLNKNEN